MMVLRMLIVAAHVLDRPALAHVRSTLAETVWRDGASTAGPVARTVKRNQQADLSTRGGRALALYLRDHIMRHPVFSVAARPKRLSPLLISRCQEGDGYGDHIDNALMGDQYSRIRTDLSFTLFLSDFEDYEGGALTIESTASDRSYRLPAGDLVLYPATSIHRVEPVVSGTRIVCAGWVESLIREDAKREILWELERVRSELGETVSAATRLRHDKAIANLLRLWCET
jgi:PKHD-type hydroxylase